MSEPAGVRFSVRENGQDVLVYHYARMEEAAEIYAFIREFFPQAEFVFEPLVH
jgi:hypothetical protein